MSPQIEATSEKAADKALKALSTGRNDIRQAENKTAYDGMPDFETWRNFERNLESDSTASWYKCLPDEKIAELRAEVAATITTKLIICDAAGIPAIWKT